MERAKSRVGVDVGGTFTDVVVVDDGEIRTIKVSSTPAAPDDGVDHGLEKVQRAGIASEHIQFFGHGTTVATNAVLEREWAETALITTDGFRDVLEIGRQARPALYDLDQEKPAPIVPRDRRFEVKGRMDERGQVTEPLSDRTISNVLDQVAGADVESVAVCLLFSFENDSHERRLTEAIQEHLPDLAASRSSAVHPEIREYERTVVTALNAALTPKMDRYLGRLDARLTDREIPADLRIMQSNGGIINAETARDRPVNTILSGPAAGVQGAAFVADQAGFEDVLTMDMGGTSCDVSLVESGNPVVSTEGQIGEYPVSVPMIDVHTIGSGGGSIAWLDAGGALRVGPRSAGADPGPMCYGRGGSEPTVTDAQVVLGRIDPTAFPSDGIDPSPAASREGIAKRIAQPMDTSVEEAAAGILAVADASMERAIRVVSVERGRDPRSFALVAFGGAGPLHATGIARSLEVPRILIPRNAGVLSALGLLISDLVHEFSTSAVRPWSAVDPAHLEERYASFEREGRDRLRADGHDPTDIETERSVTLRYRGQGYTLTISVPETIDDEALGHVADRFHAAHETRYGHASPEDPIELVTFRLRVRGRIDPPDLREVDDSPGTDLSPQTTRDVRFPEQTYETPIYDRAHVPVESAFTGPAIVEGLESTLLVHPDQSAQVDSYGTIIVRSEGDG